MVANALGNLQNEVVYVGGSVVGFYVQEGLIDELRPTDDIDFFAEITSLAELEKLREKLKSKGFRQSAEDNVMCRFRYEGIKVDVMSTKEIGWAPANKWFGPGISHKEIKTIGNINFNILSLPYFLATKFDAFEGRVETDPRLSHDIEDVAFILDNHPTWHRDILSAENEVRDFLIYWLKLIETDTKMREAILGNLEPDFQIERFAQILEKVKELRNSDI